MDSTVIADILTAANQILPIREYIFLADKGYDVRDLYNTVRDVYDGEAVIPLSKRSTKEIGSRQSHLRSRTGDEQGW